jgi:hypothetical protein
VEDCEQDVHVDGRRRVIPIGSKFRPEQSLAGVTRQLEVQ